MDIGNYEKMEIVEIINCGNDKLWYPEMGNCASFRSFDPYYFQMITV